MTAEQDRSLGAARSLPGLKLVVLATSALGAAYVGFLLEEPGIMVQVQGRYGYHACAAAAAMLLASLLPLARSARTHTPTSRLPLLVAIGTVALALLIVPPKVRIMADEGHLLGVALAMHESADNVLWEQTLPDAASGELAPLQFSYNKRPPGFPFLLSLAHDLTGPQLINAYVINALAAIGILWLTGSLAGGLQGRSHSLAAVLCMAAFPVLWAAVASAGFDAMNLLFVLAGFVVAQRLDRRPDWTLVATLLAVAAFLGLLRYESVLFSAAFVVFAAIRAPWHDWRQLPWTVAVAPWAFVGSAWQLFVPFASEVPGGQEAFSPAHFMANLANAAEFFANRGEARLSAPLIAATGGLGLGVLVVCQLIKHRRPPASTILIAVSLTLWAVLVLSYWHGNFSRPLTARLCLPLLIPLALSAGWLCDQAQRYRHPRLATALIVSGLLASAAPALLSAPQRTRSEASDVFNLVASAVSDAPAGGQTLLISWPGAWFAGLPMANLEYTTADANRAALTSLLQHAVIERVLVLELLEPDTGHSRFAHMFKVTDDMPVQLDAQLTGGARLRIRRLLPGPRPTGEAPVQGAYGAGEGLEAPASPPQ